MEGDRQPHKLSGEQQRDILIERAESLRRRGEYRGAARLYVKAADIARVLGDRPRAQIYMATAMKMAKEYDHGKGNQQEQDEFTEDEDAADEDVEEVEEKDEEAEDAEAIRSTIMELGTKFPRVQIVEIAEKSGIDDETMIVAIVLDMIKQKQIAAEFFESTQTVAFITPESSNEASKDYHESLLEHQPPARNDTSTQKSVPQSNIQIKRQYEYIGGKVRIKIKVTNPTEHGLLRLNATLDLPQSFKLLRVEPAEYIRNGTTLKLGDLLPKEEKAAAWILEPLICGKEKIGGSFSGVDASGKPFAIPIPPLDIEVRCPLFIRPEEANLASVQRLLTDLTVRSERNFILPKTLSPSDAFELVRKIIAERDVRHVGTFSGEEGQPYDQVAWFYGITKVNQKRFVIIASVSEMDRTIHISSACDEEAACTGFLAEAGASVRRELVARGAVDSEEGVVELVCEKCGATLPRAPVVGRDVACPECRSQWHVSDFIR